MSNMNSKTRSIALIVIIAVIIGLVYWPALRWMVNSWLSSDYYSHGFLVPIVSVFFIWMKRRQFNTREPSPVTGTILLMAGAVVCILGYIWEIRFMGALSLVGVLAGLVFFIWGNRLA
ncbi:MAG: exosortase/archaeosortase family protein, partial [Dehalococcoidales bacterium]|nr:exosortase/archaeosortase family protein [Dehalococcoidales bacterium]